MSATCGTMSKPRESLMLSLLPAKERERLDPYLEWVKTELEDVLIEPDEPINQMFFPYDAVTSTIQDMSDGNRVETGLMGFEGMVGIQLWLGMPTTTTRTIVQVAGYGHRMKASDFIREVRDKPSPLNQ